ncbi:unnamed protein product [Rotaria sp. Silwood1]|nr:unnamed protein product [Rotaria sp. Silwood1]
MSSASSTDSAPYLHANKFSRFIHHWISPLLEKSREQSTLYLNDLYDLPADLKSSTLTDKLEANWFDEIKRNPQKPSLIRATLRTLGWRPFLLGFLEILNSLVRIAQPLLLIFLMNFFEPCSTIPAWQAWLFAMATTIASLISGTIFNEYIYKTDLIAAQLRIAYMGLIFRKVLRLSNHSMDSLSSGEITNLISNDAKRVEVAFYLFNYIWVAPIGIILMSYLFWHFVKYIAFIAIGYTLFILLFQTLFGRVSVYFQTKIVEVTDERVKIMSEIIKSMRIVKMYCWETAFIKKINLVRKHEIIQYISLGICDCIRILFVLTHISLTFLMMYGTMWSLDIRFDTRFFAIASCMLGFMRLFVIEFFSYAVRDLSHYLPARKRIEAFLLLNESERDLRLLSSSHSEVKSIDEDKLVDDNKEKTHSSQVICHLKHAQWNKNETFSLKNIVFNAYPGDLICVIGPVGTFLLSSSSSVYRMFQRIIRCPIYFFDTNPVGRILNRFTNDVNIMDERLSESVPEFFDCAFAVVGTVALVCVLNPWSLIPAGIGLCSMLIIRYRFAQCSRDLKRLDGTTRSPIYSHLTSTIHSLKVIRSYHAEQICSNEFLHHIDNHTRVHYLIVTTDRWAAIRFNWIAFIFLALVTFLALIIRIYQQEFSTAEIAITLFYSLNLLNFFQWSVRMTVYIETNMTAVQRVLEYCSLDQESPAQVSDKNRPLSNWPSHGCIVFENVSMCYSNDDDAPLALHNVSLTIEGGEKVGIVGRTGAGKNSFIQILFRMGILIDGQIRIDDINIEDIGLDDLRSRIAIIPKDPVLFSGTIRSNLDPFNNYSDDDIWNALEQVQLKTLVNDIMLNGLDSIVNESGSNLSVGQKQLICLGRAILKQCKILIIDEATANVNNATDELIQKAIREKFKQCTVLTIAHRLRTVIDSDRIMVLGNGELLEFDTPQALLSNSNSHFTSLIEQTGSTEAQFLRTLVNTQDTNMNFDEPNVDSDEELPLDPNENDPLLK